MIKIRRSHERGRADRGWLQGYFSFSFADYHDPEHAGFRALRVLNDDRIAPGKGFGPHAHRDMEIITYVLEGRLLHRDSMGEQHVLGPNEVQTMSAGSGIVHSEFNASEDEPVHSIQIWIEPAAEDLNPSYQQIAFAPAEKQGRFRLLAGPATMATAAHDQSTSINQDARVYVANVGRAETATHVLADNRHAWVQVVGGQIALNGRSLKEGDGAAITGERELVVRGHESGEVLLFDLA
jgi:redox-sensitive bicupin YhaK (pirin superfamily)